MRITTNGISVYYEVRRQKKHSPPIIMLHGNCEDHSIFDRAADYLEQVFTVYLPDSRGHGQSSPPLNGEYHYADMADDLYDFIRKLEIDRPIICGFSDGAITAMLFAMDHPDIPSRMFLCGPNLRPDSLKGVGMAVTRLRHGNDPRVAMMLREPHIDPADLSRISCPVTVVGGSRDCVDRSELELIADSVQDGTLCIMKRADHYSYIRNSTRIVDSIFMDTGIDTSEVHVVYGFAHDDRGVFAHPPVRFKYGCTESERGDNMAPPGDTYERELKALLSGDEKVIAKMIKTCDETERANFLRISDEPFMMIRAAGSLGVDLLALRWDFSCPIEVKSSAEEVIHFSKNQRLTEQVEQMKADCARSHVVPIYAYRLKARRGDPWRIFTVPTDLRYRGFNDVLYRRIPKLEVSSNGFYIMRWENGMKLSDFIGFVSRSEFSEQRGTPSGLIGLIIRSAEVHHHPVCPYASTPTAYKIRRRIRRTPGEHGRSR